MYRNPYNPYSPPSPSEGSALCTLPTEISEQIYRSLPYGDLTRLARVNRALYTSVQSPLYRHAKVTSYERLTLFIRTLNAVACFDKSGEGAVSKHVVTLHLTIDPNASESESPSHNRPTAVMLSRMIGALGRYCPSVSITLHISNGSCNAQPLTSFELETFPRVSTLILAVGFPSISSGSSTSGPPARPSFHQVIPGRRAALESWGRMGSGCNPNAKFWSGIFNGSSFPDLREVEILHDSGSPASQWAKHVEFGEDDLKGLGKVTRLVVNSAPELNDSVLMGALTRAECLKRLELRNIVGLSYEALSMLLPHALPNLTHFTLHIPFRHRSARQAKDQLETYQPLAPTGEANPLPVHLCPLLRAYGRNLQYLEVQAPYLCRDLFLHESEKSKLNEEGVKIDLGGRGGSLCYSRSGVPFHIDRIALEQTVKQVRKQNGERAFKEAVQLNLREELSKNKTKDISSAGAVSSAEYQEEQKKLKRARTIKEQGWQRTVRFREGMCRDGESWEEIGILARLEEENVKWTCINDAIKTMGVYMNGIGSELEVYPDPPHSGRAPGRPFMAGHDYNDDYAGDEDEEAEDGNDAHDDLI
ncbi:hypothetical protein B9Z19DRAFT_1047547 [Tuber borchii]|uniref:F-box domain-containing protein n=1 Tax=Tuber borchii TaxID=42251 RepID=A0A2T6ZU09_TUBBO|nr:hypothetical protein B9Z19DRAFT_1047547 [Tuber borchii]